MNTTSNSSLRQTGCTSRQIANNERGSGERENSKLDELPENKGRKQKIIIEDCGIFCEIVA